MRIYFYLKSFTTDLRRRDGTTKAVQGLALALAAQGIPVTVLFEGPQASETMAAKGLMYRCFAHQTTAPSFQISPRLQAFLKQLVPGKDLMILNGGFHCSVYAISRILKRQRINYIVAPHLNYDIQMFNKRPWLKYPYWYLVEYQVLKDALAVQVLDRRQTKVLRDRGISSPIIEVQNGFEASDVIEADKLVWRLETDDPIRFFFLGRMSAHTKGLDLLLQAFSKLNLNATKLNLKPSLQLVMQGKDVGDNAKLLKQTAQLGIKPCVTLRSGDYSTPPPQLMANQDIFCLPSRSEGFGLSALEAMLVGRVLLVSEVAGIARHVVESGCGIAVRSDAYSVQAGLEWLLTRRSHWKEMGLRGREYAMKQLSWHTIAQKALVDYEQLMHHYPGQHNANWGSNGNEGSRVSGGVESE